MKPYNCNTCKDTGIHWFTINTAEGPEAERDACDYCDAFDKRVEAKLKGEEYEEK